MKTIQEVLDVLDGEIYSYQDSYRERDRIVRNKVALHTIDCLKRARQIVKASQRGSDWNKLLHDLKQVTASQRGSAKKKGGAK